MFIDSSHKTTTHNILHTKILHSISKSKHLLTDAVRENVPLNQILRTKVAKEMKSLVDNLKSFIFFDDCRNPTRLAVRVLWTGHKNKDTRSEDHYRLLVLMYFQKWSPFFVGWFKLSLSYVNTILLLNLSWMMAVCLDRCTWDRWTNKYLKCYALFRRIIFTKIIK